MQETLNLNALAREHGLKKATLHSRLRNGWTLEEALKAPVGPNCPKVSYQELGTRHGINPGTLKSRVRLGYTIEEAIAAGPADLPKVEWNGEQWPLKKLARHHGIGWQTLRTRLKKGWTVDQALSTPIKERKVLETPSRQSRAYRAWSAAKSRCNDVNSKAYRNYGARGIYMCERWAVDFRNFLEDMGEPAEGLSLERRDNDGPYAPENCIWATKSEQARNRRSPRLRHTAAILQAFGTIHTVRDWAIISGVPESTIRGRLRQDCSVEDALFPYSPATQEFQLIIPDPPK